VWQDLQRRHILVHRVAEGRLSNLGIGKRTVSAILIPLVILLAWLGAGTAASAAEQTSGDYGDLIIVNKKTNRLAYFSGGKLKRTFPVATGKTNDLTPEGTFTIANKIKNRPYYKENIPGGDPSNPLGDRWLGLDVNGTKGTTYAIHGNNDERSIGKYVSAGCIRMRNDDIHWLYPLVKVRTKVIILRSDLTFEAIAAKRGFMNPADLVAAFTGKLSVNGETMTFRTPLIKADGRVYVPLRELTALLGGVIRVDANTREITAELGIHTVTHVPLTNTATVDGEPVHILPSRVHKYTVMLPLKDLARLSGYYVTWDARTQTITMSG